MNFSIALSMKQKDITSLARDLVIPPPPPPNFQIPHTPTCIPVEEPEECPWQMHYPHCLRLPSTHQRSQQKQLPRCCWQHTGVPKQWPLCGRENCVTCRLYLSVLTEPTCRSEWWPGLVTVGLLPSENVFQKFLMITSSSWSNGCNKSLALWCTHAHWQEIYYSSTRMYM